MQQTPSDYQIYGLHVRADRPLPGLTPVAATMPADISVHLGVPRRDPPVPDAAAWSLDLESSELVDVALRLYTSSSPRGVYSLFQFEDGTRTTEFIVDPTASHIWVSWTPEPMPEAVGVVLVWQVLPYVLRVRGYACLHASAVRLGDRAIAFAGHKGAGKSTTVAALVRMGCPAVADDIALLSEGKGRNGTKPFLVHPGYPGLRLWPEVARELFGASEAIYPDHRAVESRPMKSYVDLVRANIPISDLPLPLAGIYFLGRREPGRDGAAITPISGTAGLSALAPHARATLPLGREERARDFAVLGHLARTVPLRYVHRPDGLESLPAICEAIRDDARALAG